MRKLTFQTDKNRNSFIYSVDHSDIFDHKYCQAIFSIYYSMLIYQYLTWGIVIPGLKSTARLYIIAYTPLRMRMTPAYWHIFNNIFSVLPWKTDLHIDVYIWFTYYLFINIRGRGFVHTFNRYSKTCLKRPLKFRQNKDLNDKWYLNAGRKYCRMLAHSAILVTCIKR